MIYILYIEWQKARVSVPTVGDVKLTMWDNELASLEAAEGGTYGRTVAANRLQVSEWAQAITGTACAKNLSNLNFNHYIHVLLIKTNPMIYNILYKICSLVGICVLAVKDNKLNVRDNNTSSEVARGTEMLGWIGLRKKKHSVEHMNDLPWLWISWVMLEIAGDRKSQEPLCSGRWI